MMLSDVCLSVVYIGPKSRTERPRKTKIGTEVAHVTRDSDTTFEVKRSKVKVIGAGAYCVDLLHSLFVVSAAVERIATRDAFDGRFVWFKQLLKAHLFVSGIEAVTLSDYAFRHQIFFFYFPVMGYFAKCNCFIYVLWQGDSERRRVTQ